MYQLTDLLTDFISCLLAPQQHNVNAAIDASTVTNSVQVLFSDIYKLPFWQLFEHPDPSVTGMSVVPVAVLVSPVWGIVVDHSFHSHTAKSNITQTGDGW